MYKELMSLCKRIQEYYYTSEEGMRYMFLNVPMKIDTPNNPYIDRIILDKEKISLISSISIINDLNEVSNREFFDIACEKLFTLQIMNDNHLFNLNDDIIKSRFPKLRYSMINAAYIFKSNLYK